MIQCRDCETAPESGNHKGHEVLACPECGDILLRGIYNESRHLLS